MISKYISRICGIIFIYFSIYLRDDKINYKFIAVMIFFIIGIILVIKGEFTYKKYENYLNRDMDINNIVFNDIMSKILLWLVIIFLVGILIEKPRIYNLLYKDTQISNGSIELMDIDENINGNNLKDKIKFMYNKKVIFYIKKVSKKEDTLYINLSIDNNTKYIIRCNPHKFFAEDDKENLYFLDILKNLQLKNEILPRKNNEMEISLKQIQEDAKNITLHFYIDSENSYIIDENYGHLNIDINLEELK